MRLGVYIFGLLLALEAFAASAELEFKDIRGQKQHPLAIEDKSGSVLLFYWHDCPICNSYAPEINRLSAQHTNFSFYIVQVDPELTITLATNHAAEYNLKPPVLLDSKHELVNIAKATVTPEVVVFGKAGKVVYRGRIDDLYAALGKRRSAPHQHDLGDALDQISAGKKVKITHTTPIGCVIPALKK